jgi:hypothetical protein
MVGLFAFEIGQFEVAPVWLQCAPDDRHLADWELTGIAGLSEDGSHGQASFPHAVIAAWPAQGRRGRRITAPIVGPLFASETADGDQTSGINGTIYVLRSKSDHPVVAANRDLLHEIGVTGGDWHGASLTRNLTRLS